MLKKSHSQRMPRMALLKDGRANYADVVAAFLAVRNLRALRRLLPLEPRQIFPRFVLTSPLPIFPMK